MIKAVIFDCFGVLVAEGWKPFATKHFGEATEENERRKWANSRMHTVSRGEMTHEELAVEMEKVTGVPQNEFLDELHFNPLDEPLLTYIKTELKPHFKIGFVSNVGANRLADLFSPEQIALFDEIVLSFEVGMAKPETGIYGHTVKLLGVLPEECVFVDDTQLYCDGAKAVGMQSILYTEFNSFKQQLEEMI